VLRVRVALLLCVAMAAMGQTAPKRPAAARPAGAVKGANEDRQIEAAIRARFARSKINEDHFQVRVQGGVATIEGRTDVLQHKGVATRLAKSNGATAVINKIEVSEAAREKAAANLALGRRRAQVKRSDVRSERR